MPAVATHGAQRMARAPHTVAGVIDAIGTDEFGAELVSFLNATCRAEHCAFYRMSNDTLRSLGAISLDGTDAARRMVVRYVEDGYWRRDPSIREARHREHDTSLMLIRLDPSQIRDRAFRDALYAPTRIRERVMICGRRADSLYGLSVLRSHATGAFDDVDMAELGRNADVLLSALAKHTQVTGLAKAAAPAALATVPDIEERISTAPTTLTAREVEVCARILFGLTITGIALDLGIKEESVSTYRKRAYQRLGIATRHELMRWYLGLQPGGRAEAALA